jgi:hypothetical protein
VGGRWAGRPGGVARLSKLRELNISDNRLRRLPPELAACNRLHILDLYGNALEDTTALAELPALVTLDVASNRLRAVGRLPSPATLTSLDLSSNLIASLPASISDLQALRRLDLSGNQLTSSSLAVLSRLPLEELYLDDNKLESPPLDLVSLPTLRRFSALGNPFGQLPPDAGERVIGEEAAAAVRQHISGSADPERKYFDAPTYSFDFSLAIRGGADAKQVVDLYYKRYQGISAAVEFRDGTNYQLDSLSRRTALDLLERYQRSEDTALVSLGQTKNGAVVQSATAFMAQAIARLDQSKLVPKGVAEPSIHFTQVRVLNVALTDTQRRVLAETATLAPDHDYIVRIDIGPKEQESVVANPIPIPTENLKPSSSQGWWFDVVVASSDVDVAADVHRLFLPFAGRSWVCDCERPEHVCSTQQRQPYLYVPIRTRTHTGEATLRCTIYDRNNAVQSVCLQFVVADGRAGSSAIRGVIDYSLADDVSRAQLLEPRRLNILTNESTTGTHKIIVNDGNRAIAVDLTEAQATSTLKQLRAKLREISLGNGGNDNQNGKKTDAFVQDLRQLALLGWHLYIAVAPDRDDRAYLREQLAERATIQISRVTRTVFPWALIYDIPRELDAGWTLCPLLKEWETSRAQLAAYPHNCPYKAEHHMNVLCPYGFWGFRHLIEQPPSIGQGVLRTRIRVTKPDRAAAARSLALNQALTEAHFNDLRGSFEGRFDLDACDSRDAIRQAFADPGLPLVYFYCHGKTALLAGTELPVPFLEIGVNDRIGATDFAAWEEDGKWGPTHWSEVAPLVFINGCETAKLNPEDVVSFVDALAGMNAAGVVGTEIPVTQQLAGEVALRFYRQFAGPSYQTVGTALYRTRIDLLIKGNVSGLVYTPFCSMDLSLEQAG